MNSAKAVVGALVALVADLQSIVEQSGKSSDELRQRISDVTTNAVQVVGQTPESESEATEHESNDASGVAPEKDKAPKRAKKTASAE